MSCLHNLQQSPLHSQGCGAYMFHAWCIVWCGVVWCGAVSVNDTQCWLPFVLLWTKSFPSTKKVPFVTGILLVVKDPLELKTARDHFSVAEAFAGPTQGLVGAFGTGDLFESVTMDFLTLIGLDLDLVSVFAHLVFSLKWSIP